MLKAMGSLHFRYAAASGGQAPEVDLQLVSSHHARRHNSAKREVFQNAAVLGCILWSSSPLCPVYGTVCFTSIADNARIRLNAED